MTRSVFHSVVPLALRVDAFIFSTTHQIHLDQQFQRLSRQFSTSSSRNLSFKMAAAAESKFDLSKIAENKIKKVPEMEELTMGSLWSNDTVVITMFRRFGCLFCRQGAKELSTITSLLKANGVRQIGVGLEEFGLDEFVKGEYFNGELYVDINKKTYQDIGYKRYNTFSVFMTLLSSKARAAISKNKTEKLDYNMKGDGVQTGGVLVIEKGGKVLLDFRQDNPADHCDNSEILKVLGISDPNAKAATPPTPEQADEAK